jgi:hypothetical protein
MGYRKTGCLIFILLLLVSGCSKTPEASPLTPALEDLKKPLSLMNDRFSLYENALQTASAYVETPGPETLEAAEKACAVAVAEIAELSAPTSSLTSDERSALAAIGLNMADYDVPFTYADYYKYENIRTLTLVSYYLSRAPEADESLEYLVAFNLRFQAVDRKLEYIGLNSLLCSFDGDELESFKTEFLPNLKALCADDLPWETDSAALEAKAEYWFEEIETYLVRYAQFVGEQYDTVLTTEATYRDALTNAGYTQEEAQEIIARIGDLKQAAEIVS